MVKEHVQTVINMQFLQYIKNVSYIFLFFLGGREFESCPIHPVWVENVYESTRPVFQAG